MDHLTAFFNRSLHRYKNGSWENNFLLKCDIVELYEANLAFVHAMVPRIARILLAHVKGEDISSSYI